jgi:hydrogenase-4 component E
MGVIEFAAAKTIMSSAVFLFILLLLMAAAHRISTCVVLFGGQSAVIAAQVLATAYAHHAREAYLVAGLVLIVKVVIIPYGLLRVSERLKVARGVRASTSSAQSVFVTAGLILLAYLVVQPYVRALGLRPDMLGAAVALVLTGAFLMVSRKTALMQVIGLLVLENGIFLAALTTTFGMPLVVEIGIVFDLLMGVLVMGLFVFRIRDTFEHLDVSRLRRLRG